MYSIDTADNLRDVEEMCWDRIERGLFSPEDAIRTLENGYGGVMRCAKSGQGYEVSHIASENKWLRDMLKKGEL